MALSKNQQLLTFFCVLFLAVLLSVLHSNIEYEYPEFLRSALNEPLFKLIVLVCITFIAFKNFVIGLLLAMIFVFSITNISSVQEGFENGSPLAHCNTYQHDKINKLGTVYYPLHDNENTHAVRGGNNHPVGHF